MNALLLATMLLVVTLVTSPTACIAGEDVNLSTVTCGAKRMDGTRINLRMIAAAYVGRATAKAGQARLSLDFVKTIGATITRACEGPDAAANTPVTQAAPDKVGQGLPERCREPGNAIRRMTDLTQDLK